MSCDHHIEKRNFICIRDSAIVYKCSCGMYVFNSTPEGVVAEDSDRMTDTLRNVLQAVKGMFGG